MKNRSDRDAAQIAAENAVHAESSPFVRRLGFRPAFLDCATMRIYPSCFLDGRPAPFHLLDGLPAEAVVERAPTGRVVRAKATLVSGFERGGFFFTRSAAARACREWVAH